ncbi:MAG: thylakoid membrane photosystem I accumulation factor [Cyanobacteria bacterium P01_F01_bin.33]
MVVSLLQSFLRTLVWVLCLGAIALSLASPSWAALNDDRYDGNIFALYGSNGGIVPSRTTLAESLERHTPTLLVYYIEDSRDCKTYSAAIANLQVRYGLGVSFIALNADSFDPDAVTDPDNPGRYYRGLLPQTLLFDADGNITYESVGDRPITEVENAIRSIFGLEAVEPGELRPQPFNELQTGFNRRPAPSTAIKSAQ